ncbi:unnamed protein product, partial [Ixodes persulcatus]
GVRTGEVYVYPRLLEERSSDGLKLVSVDGKKILRLEKASVLAETLLVTSYDENGQMTHTPIQAEEIEKHHYRDREQYASLMVRDTGNGLEMIGMVDAATRIEPVHTAPRSLEGSLPHRLHTLAEEDLERLRNIGESIEDSYVPPPRPVPIDRNWLTATQEMLIISDSKHHEEMTREQLCVYVVIFMTAVRMRFDQTTFPTLRFRMVEILMTTEVQERKFLKMYGEYVEPTETLRNMYDFTRQYEQNYPDVFLVLTGRDIAVKGGGKLYSATAGLANVGGACTTYSNYALSEDRGQAYLGITFAAHELGHSYGCVHDGDEPDKFIPGHRGAKDPECAFEKGYIMSYVDGGTNRYYFSSCSLEQIRLFLSNQVPSCFNNTFQHDLMTSFPNLQPARITPVLRYCQAAYPDLEGVFNEPVILALL